jgi:hypothetical protein
MGRRAHVGDDRFNEFFSQIPDEARSTGYWRIKKENYTEAGGIVQSFLGFIPFNAQESYETLKTRIRDTYAVNKGFGVYFCIPCDDRKHELKSVDMVKIEFKEQEVPVAAGGDAGGGGNGSGGDPLKDAMGAVKRVNKDIAEMQAMKMQQKLMKDLMGDDEEDDVKESPGMLGGGMENFMLYKSLFEDKKKDDSSDLKATIAKLEAKLENHNGGRSEVSELRDLVKDLIRNQQSPKEDNLKVLIEEMKREKSTEKQESTLQTMFAMQVKAQEERDRNRDAEMRADRDRREAEEKRKEEERREELRRY